VSAEPSPLVTAHYRQQLDALDPAVRADAERLAAAMHADNPGNAPVWEHLGEHDRLAWIVSAARWLRVARSLGLVPDQDDELSPPT
jgi:hypothetical protein